jgi:hypothetical protein
VENLTDLLPISIKRVASASRVKIGGDFNVDPTKQCMKTKQLEIWQTDAALDQLEDVNTRFRLVNGILQQPMISGV